MANILALEWDSHEARIAVARRRGADVVIDHAFCVELKAGEGAPDATTLSDTDVGERIAAALASRRIGRSDALIAVGRSGVELRLLSLPPAPDDELPELVRFQAMRQFSTLGEDWPLDYLPVDQQQADMPRSVLAAAISPELVEQIRQNCEVAQLRVQRMVLRPCAAASLFLGRHAEPDGPSVRLLVDVLAEEADLTVTVDQTVVFMRTVRLSGEWNSPQQAQTLLGEIRRTRAAVQNQLGGQPVEQVVLFGSDDDHSTLKSQIETLLELPTVAYNPFAKLSLSSEVRSRPPERPGSFAPLLGILADECAGTPHAIDFLHPRKKAEPPSRSRVYGIAGAVAACVVLGLAGYIWMGLRNLDRQIAQRDVDLATLDEDMERTKRIMDEAAEIDRWVTGDVTWLDELARLSKRMPSADSVRLTRLQIDGDDRQRTGEDARDPRRRGRIRLEGYARDHGAISDIEYDLRGDYHHTRSDGGRKDSHDPDYPWRFNAEITIDKPASEPMAATTADDAGKQTDDAGKQTDDAGKQTDDAGKQTDEPASGADKLTEDNDEPAEENDESTEDNDKATEDIDKPAEDNDEPAEKNDEPAEENDEPAEDNDKPAEDNDKPAEENDEPAEDNDKAAEDNDKPAEENDEPAEDNDKAAEDNDKPAEENDEPAEDNDNPAGPTEKPVDDSAKPAEIKEIPVRETEEPVDDSDEPAESTRS